MTAAGLAVAALVLFGPPAGSPPRAAADKQGSTPAESGMAGHGPRVPGQNLMETFNALPVRSRATRKASPTSSIGSIWLSSGDTSIAAPAISRTAYRNDSRPGSPWAPYVE